MTPAESFDGQPDTPNRAVAFQGLECVGRTRRHVAARRRASGEHTLVAAYGTMEQSRNGAHGDVRFVRMRSSRMVFRNIVWDHSSIGAVTRIR